MNAGSRLAGKSHKASQALVKERNEVLKAGLENLLHHQKLREAEAQKPNKTTSAINPDHVKVYFCFFINSVMLVLVIKAFYYYNNVVRFYFNVIN